MKDKHKTKEQLVNELAELRQRVAELKAADTGRQRAQKAPFVHGSKDQPVVQPTTYQSPVLLVTIIALLILVSEAFVMIIIPFLPPFPTSFEALLDSAFLVILLSPMLYFFLFRPLALHTTERERAEEALRESEEKYHNLFEYANDSIFISGPETHRFLDVNENAARRLGYTREELLQLTFDDIDTAIAADRNEAILRKLQETDSATFEHAHRRKDGTEMPVEISARVIEYGGQQVFQSFVRDITARKQVEEALRGSEKRFRSVLQTASDAVITIDDHGIITFWNRAAEFMFGYSADEVAGRLLAFIMPERFREAHQKAVQRVISTGESRIIGQTVEVVGLKKDGSEFPIELSLASWKMGEETFFTAIVRDITDRKRAEREIEERRTYLEGVLREAPDAIVTLDAHHRIMEWNTGAEKLFGYSPEEVIGQNLDDLITNPDVYEEATGFTQSVMGGMEVPPTEAVRYRKDGSPVDVLVAGSPILVGDELIGVVAVYTDITARVRMEETLRALALLDELTDLYNRRGFSILAEQQLKMAHRAKRRMVLLFADLNGLKQINDTLGHQEGDRALIEAAEALEETFRESDIIARIGGDEFVVLAIETNGSPAEVLVHRLQENLEARNARGGRRYELSLSVGLARYDPERLCSIDELVAQADRAMYERKRG